MNIVYASLTRQRTGGEPPTGEVAEIVGTLWAHATTEDGLQYASGRPKPDRVDLLLFLLPAGPPESGIEQRVNALLTRCHHASRNLQQRYLPPSQ